MTSPYETKHRGALRNLETTIYKGRSAMTGHNAASALHLKATSPPVQVSLNVSNLHFNICGKVDLTRILSKIASLA